MYFATNLRLIFVVVTTIVIGGICIVKIGTIDLHTVIATAKVLTPAAIVIGYLGYRIGDIIDNPRNRADADYKISVLNALKKMDKSITLEQLNEKLSKQVAEPDLPDEKDDVDE